MVDPAFTQRTRIGPRFSAHLEQSRSMPTERELEVLAYVADGLSDKLIARALFLSEETIKSHLRHLYAKLNAHNRTHAVVLAVRLGLLDIG